MKAPMMLVIVSVVCLAASHRSSFRGPRDILDVLPKGSFHGQRNPTQAQLDAANRILADKVVGLHGSLPMKNYNVVKTPNGYVLYGGIAKTYSDIPRIGCDLVTRARFSRGDAVQKLPRGDQVTVFGTLGTARFSAGPDENLQLTLELTDAAMKP